MPGGSHIVLCGSDGLAIRVLAELVALGESIVVVTEDDQGMLADLARESDVAVVIGDFRRTATLHRARIGEAAALALLEQDDVSNIGMALAAQEDNPAVHLVVRMFNIELGRTLEGLFVDCRILSAAALAAPAFADAAIHGQTGQSVRVCGRELEVRELPADDPDVVVTLMTRDDSGAEELFPTSGERVLALTERVDGESAGRRRARQVASLRDRLAARLGGIAHLFDRRLALLLAALVVIVAISSAVFEHYYDLSWTDAVSGTITTVAGGGNIDLARASAGLKFYGAAITAAGALTVAVLFALVTDAIVGVRLARALGEPPLPSADHMVVCGLGRIGFRVVERLVEREIPCIAVEQAEDGPFIATARRLGVPVIVADASLPETLAELRLDRARCLLAVTSDDVANLQAALAARALRPDLRIVLRLFDADLAERVERKFGIHISRSLAALAAPAFVAALLERHMIGVIGIGRRVLPVTEVRVAAGSSAAGRTVGEIERSCECQVLAIGGRFAPGSDELVEPGGLTVVASLLGLRRLNRETAGG
jgi:Trk K+ transport system NAD-binding subunit